MEYMFTKEKELSVSEKLNSLLAQSVEPHCKSSKQKETANAQNQHMVEGEEEGEKH